MDKFIFGCIDVHFGLTLIPTYQYRSPRRNFKALGKLDLVLLSLGGCNLVLNMYPCEYISNAMDGSEVDGFYNITKISQSAMLGFTGCLRMPTKGYTPSSFIHMICHKELLPLDHT